MNPVKQSIALFLFYVTLTLQDNQTCAVNLACGQVYLLLENDTGIPD